MFITHRSIRRSGFAGLVAALTLLGCGETSPPAPEVASPVVPALVPVVTTAEPTAASDRALRDASAAQVGHNIQHETADLKAGLTQAADDARSEAKQAATAATDGVQGFATELRGDAAQTATGALDQAKTSAQQAAAGAKQQVQNAVDGAKDNVRRRARAAGADLGKQVQDAEDQVLNGLLGPAPKN